MSITVTEAWEYYLELKVKTFKDQKNDPSRWKNYIFPVFGNKEIAQIKSIDIIAWRAELEEKLRPQTVKHCLALLKRILNKSVHWELYSGPLPYFEMPRFDNKRSRFLNYTEAQYLLSELKSRSVLWHDIAFLSLLTGLRAKEIFSLQKGNIHIENRQISITDTKSSQNRILPLSEDSLNILVPYLQKSKTLIFVNQKGNPFRQVSKIFSSTIKYCKFNAENTPLLERVVFHTLRHTFASWLIQDGTPTAIVSYLLGHSDIRTTMCYAHLDNNAGRNEVNLLLKNRIKLQKESRNNLEDLRKSLQEKVNNPFNSY